MTTVLITGVTDGIGRALAQHYAAAGAHVVGVGRRPVEAAPPGIFPPAAYCQIDLAQPDAGRCVASFLDALGIEQLDMLIHNAAAGWYGPVAEQPAASVDELLAVNLRAPVALTHALLPRLAAARGAVAFVSSVHAALPAPEFAVYTASKAALDGFARSLRIELAGQAEVLTLWAGAPRAGSSAPPSTGLQAVITGAAEGIGRALAEAFGAQGYAVTGVDVNATLSAQTEAELAGRGVQIRFVPADLSQPAEVARLAAELSAGPAIDLLIHNAGINCVGAFAESDLAAQQQVLDVNLAVALAPQGIHVLTVYPGPTRTAHARRYSLDNSREARRMAPDFVAAAVVRAVQRRRRVLVPGLGNQLFAVVGRWLPPLGEWAMRKTLWEKLAH